MITRKGRDMKKKIIRKVKTAKEKTEKGEVSGQGREQVRGQGRTRNIFG